MDNTANLNDVSLIVRDTVFKGVLTSTKDIRIDGKFDGQIDTKGGLEVGQNGVVNGTIKASNLDFAGVMKKGQFLISDTVSLKAGCLVEGDLQFSRILVERDARINGKCQVVEKKVAVSAPAPAKA